ncbi:hypothetical protein SNE40_016428 [Patella caerulea]|uniref:Uncharacterized protein n=1 Tax=Patella caerulea TaxID=87958 RepID=A0AAN8JBF2_PATCE
MSTRCNLYHCLQNNYELQYYLCKNVTHKTLICKYRISAHDLQIEKGRYSNIQRSNRLCKFCNCDEIEDEFHALLVCPSYKYIREKYIEKFYWLKPSMYKLELLLKSTNIKTLNNLGRYLYLMLQKKNKLL